MLALNWINCHGHIERRTHMESMLGRTGYASTRFAAIEHQRITFEPPYTKPGYACLLSHIGVQLRLATSVWPKWALVGEDDIELFGVIDVEKLVADAPEDATLLQLATLAHGAYDDAPLWRPTTNGYYGTQLYLVNCERLREVLSATGIYEHPLEYYLDHPLPHVKHGLLVADSYVYCMHRSYLCGYPFAISRIELGSTLHPEHLDMHATGWKHSRHAFESRGNPYLVGA